LGRFSAAAKALTSNGVHQMSQEVFQALLDKFPQADLLGFLDTMTHLLPDQEVSTFQSSDEQVLNALSSFPLGSGAGRDGLKAQHLKDSLQNTSADSRKKTLGLYTKYVNPLLSGGLPQCLSVHISSAPVVPLKKKV
jgi:hypothetical protein